MKIGIDGSFVMQSKIGIGSFAQAFLERLKTAGAEHQFFFYKPQTGGDMTTLGRIFWESRTLPRMAEKDGVDVLYSPGFSPPPWGRFKKVVTVHDLIGLVYPKNVGLGARLYWSWWLPRNVRRADALVASSQSTRRDIQKHLKIPADRVQVLPLAVNSVFFHRIDDEAAVQKSLADYGLRQPYLLAVGTLEPRKNSLRLLQAFDKVASETDPLQLVFVGKDGGMEKKLRRYIDDHNMRDRVKLLGYVPDQALSFLYNGAIGYAMISLYEGFGLPALEGMSCGLAGIVSGVSSLPEVAGDTAITVNPENEDSVADAIKQLASDAPMRVRMGHMAQERSKQFSYVKTAEAMIEIFKKALT